MRVIYFLLLVHRTLCQDYSQTRTLLGGDLVLHYTVEDHKFKFKLEGRADQQIGLAFSYHSDPQDGFVSLLTADDRQLLVDLTLAPSGVEDSGGFKMVRDEKTNLVVESTQIGDVRTLVGYRSVDNCNDQNEDIYLKGDILKLFYMMGSDIYDERMNELDIDMNKRSVFGSDFISLHTKVQTNFTSLETSFKSFSAELEKIRPVAGGESKCRMMKAPSRSKYLTGFTPIIHGYNGENGLIQQMTLYQCSAEVKYDRRTGGCEEEEKEACSEVMFVWRPGSGGEALPQGTGLERKDRKLMLEVVYNSGTGWLYDQSGMEIFYSEAELSERVVKVTVRGGREEESSLVTGLCAGDCLSPATAVTVLSVSLHGEKEGMVSLASEAGVLVSGYREEYQPTRYLMERVEARQLELRCSARCWAIVTILAPPDLNLTQCGSERSGESYCESGVERRSLGVLDKLGERQEEEENCSISQTKVRDVMSTTSSGTIENIPGTPSTKSTGLSGSSSSTENSEDQISNISDILQLNSVNFNSLNKEMESSTAPTMKIDIAIIEETSPSLPLELEDVTDLEINDIDTFITQEEDLDIPDIVNVTLDSINEGITEIPTTNMEINTTEVEQEIEVSNTRESRFLENPTSKEYLSEKDGQINFSKVYRSEASRVSYIGYISVLYISTFLL